MSGDAVRPPEEAQVVIDMRLGAASTLSHVLQKNVAPGLLLDAAGPGAWGRVVDVVVEANEQLAPSAVIAIIQARVLSQRPTRSQQ